MTLPPAAPYLEHAGPQFPFGDVLDVLVNRELEVSAGGRRPLHAARHGVTPRVRLDQDATRLATNHRVVRGLDAVQALTVGAHVSENVRRERELRVVALVFLEEADAVELERRDATGLVGRHLPFDEGERAVPSETLSQSASIALRAAESGAKARCGLARLLELRRDGVDRFRIDRVREDPAIAIEDFTPLGRRLDRPVLLALGPRHEVGVLRHLQVDEPRLDCEPPEREEPGRHENARLERGPPRRGLRWKRLDVVHGGTPASPGRSRDDGGIGRRWRADPLDDDRLALAGRDHAELLNRQRLDALRRPQGFYLEPEVTIDLFLGRTLLLQPLDPITVSEELEVLPRREKQKPTQDDADAH